MKKIKNGFDYSVTFLTDFELEPTNNRAERALREHVVQRKNQDAQKRKENVNQRDDNYGTGNLGAGRSRPYEGMLKAFRNHS